MGKNKVHKEAVNYSSFTSYPAICGADFRLGKKGKSPVFTSTHWNWRKVTCKRCLKKRGGI